MQSVRVLWSRERVHCHRGHDGNGRISRTGDTVLVQVSAPNASSISVPFTCTTAKDQLGQFTTNKGRKWKFISAKRAPGSFGLAMQEYVSR